MNYASRETDVTPSPNSTGAFEDLKKGLAALDNKLESIHQLITKGRKEHLVVAEVAELTGRSAYTIRRWISEGMLNAIRLKDGGPRGKLLVPRTELDRLVAAGRGEGISGGFLTDQPVDPQST